MSSLPTQFVRQKIRGEAVYVFAYDLAYDMRRTRIEKLLGQPVEQLRLDVGRRGPRTFTYYRPQMVKLPPLSRVAFGRPVQVERVVKVFPVGAISVSLRVKFEVDELIDLVEWHELVFEDSSVEQDAEALARDAMEELRPLLIRPLEELADEEAYTVFCIDPPQEPGGAFSAPQWLAEHRDELARVLTAEPGPEELSDQEAAESTGVHLSYYEHDLLVVDWDAALLIDEPDRFEETIHVIELANVQLAELNAYDKILDEALERSYRDVAGRGLRHRRELLRDLREIRIDLARFSDELSNITKFFGDWHMARTYQSLATRFHLSEWDASVEAKLRTVDGFYQILKQDQMNRWMLWLEISIVALFLVDIVVIFYEIFSRK